MNGSLSDADRTVYRALIDALLPASGPLPAASAAGGADGMLDRLLEWRPDLSADLKRGLAAVRELPPAAAIAWLESRDAEAFQAIRLAAFGNYYLDPGVRQALGYPGQQSRPLVADAKPDYLTSGVLEPVIARGSIWRNANDHSPKEQSAMTRHVFLAFTNPVKGRENDFNDWQNNEHLPHGLQNPGFVKATRYRLADAQFSPGEGRAQYLTIWEIDSNDIETTLAQAGERNKTAVYTDALDFSTIGTVVYTALPKSD